ncbi:MAG: 6-carboxytetrahydropterin synthase QueD [Thermodesulfobacteriota bacterium]
MSKKAHFEISIQTHFSAAHHLRGYAGDCQKPHGHNWTVEVYLICDRLNEIGIGIDFLDIEKAAKSILHELDHNDLNTLPQFQSQNPTSENVARYLYHELTNKLNVQGVRITKVRVSENPNCAVVYWED